MPKQAIADMCERVTGTSRLMEDKLALPEVIDHLASRGSHLEASRVLLDYAQNVDAAVDVLCRGTDFPEAYRIVICSSSPPFRTES